MLASRCWPCRRRSRPGDRVAVVAPSSPFPRDELLARARVAARSLPSLHGGRGCCRATGTSPATTPDAPAELARALLDPEVKAIVAARGGYGAMRIARRAPVGRARAPAQVDRRLQRRDGASRRWPGAAASRRCTRPNVTGLGGDVTPATRAAWLASLERPPSPHAWAGAPRGARRGRARVPSSGGISRSCRPWRRPGAARAARRGAGSRGRDRAPYRVDRMLTSLRLGGHFARASAVVFGDFERCAPGADGRTVDDVLAERTARPRRAGARGRPVRPRRPQRGVRPRLSGAHRR